MHFKVSPFLLTMFFLLTSLNMLHADEKIKVVAFAQDNMANDFRKAQVFEVRDTLAKHKNIKFIYSDANAKTSKLIFQIDNFIKSGVDLIIVGTHHADAVVDVVSKAYKMGIPVIILDRGINSEEYTLFINSDNVKIGKIGAKYIAKQLHGKGKVLLLEGLQTADVTKLRTKGFMDEIKKHKNIEVIKRTANYLRRDAIFEIEKLIKLGVKFDAIFSHSDSMLSGVRSAMLHFHKDPSTTIMVGCDYTSEAQQAIRQGAQTASVKFPLGGKEAAEYAVKILQGKVLSKHIYIPVRLITKENVEKIEPIF